jgi:hypothetical protein
MHWSYGLGWGAVYRVVAGSVHPPKIRSDRLWDSRICRGLHPRARGVVRPRTRHWRTSVTGMRRYGAAARRDRPHVRDRMDSNVRHLDRILAEHRSDPSVDTTRRTSDAQ